MAAQHMTFEQAEQQLSAQEKAQLVRAVLSKQQLPHPLTQAQQVFCFGVYAMCEYEQKNELACYLEENASICELE